MAKESNDLQKQYAFQYLAIARQEWERLGIKYSDYLSDRDAFYKRIRQEVMPEFVKRGGDEEVFLDAMREYARDDWVNTGFDEKEFDKRFKSAKRRASHKLTLGILGSIFIAIIGQLVESFIGISMTRFFKQFDEERLKGYVILFIFSFIVLIVAIAAGQWVVNRYRNNNDDEVKPLKLN